MPSFGEQDATAVMQTVTTSSLASNTFKSIIENPLKFERATLSVPTGLNGRYIPLNKPFQHSSETANGVHNGLAVHQDSSLGANGSGETEESNNDGLVNGEGSAQKSEMKISTEWPRILQRPPGLKNFSNTCYMNSTLQAIMHIPPLVGFLLRGIHGSICHKTSRICAVCRLERHARESYPQTSQRSPYLDPSGIIGKQGVLNKFYNVHKQEDAHELFLHLLDKMDEAEKRAHHNPKYKSIIQKIFGGECRQSITCENCGNVSHTTQAFIDLGLDLLTRERDIRSSLQDFTRQETLSQDNQYKCEKCNMKSRAKKVTTLHSVPPILSIHLKRFSASGIRKNTILIQYPEELDLNPYMSEESQGIPKYRLIATVCHHGFDFSGMSSGHYTANCKSASGVWHTFDDIRISKVSLSEVLKDRDAYILFYARDDSTSTQKQTSIDDSTLNTLPHTSEMNGTNGNISPSGKKRPASDSDEEPSKRRRLFNGEGSDIENRKYTPSTERQPMKSINDENIETNLSNQQKTYSKSSNSSMNNSSKTPLISNTSHRPYGPKQFPIPRVDKPQQNPVQRPEVKRGAESQFFRDLESNSDAQHRPLPSQSPGEKQISTKNGLKQSISQRQQHLQAPRHRLSQYDFANSSPHDDPDADPFAHGYQQSARNRNQGQSGHPRPRIPGCITSAIQPGETSSFMRDLDGKKGAFATNDGIKIRRTK